MSGSADRSNDLNFEQIMKLAEYNYYHEGEHLGLDTFQTSMNQYGFFLNEGDFENWQPFTVMDRKDPLFIKAFQTAKLNLLRANWIHSRFLTWGSNEWFRYVLEFDRIIREYQFYEELTKGISADKAVIKALHFSLNVYKDPNDPNNR